MIFLKQKKLDPNSTFAMELLSTYLSAYFFFAFSLAKMVKLRKSCTVRNMLSHSERLGGMSRVGQGRVGEG